jgi:hypothetical protein
MKNALVLWILRSRALSVVPQMRTFTRNWGCVLIVPTNTIITTTRRNQNEKVSQYSRHVL